MYKKIYFSTLILLVFSLKGLAQQYLSGKILKRGSPDIVEGVNIKNRTAGKYNKSDMGGNYRIAASPGDTIYFTSAGYVPDTIIAGASMLLREYDVYLKSNIVALPVVEVDALSKYEADSLQRRIDYANLYNRKHPIKLMNEKIPYDKPGFSFSPIGYFSKREKSKRRLLKRLKEEDENEYVDVRFARTKVAQLTRLTGDSLQQFMILYRPSYAYCRVATNTDISLYINDKLILFKHGDNNKKK
ncbi:MAG: hypothetical protein QM726_21865 [Chitinophagaceae bacterium]